MMTAHKLSSWRFVYILALITSRVRAECYFANGTLEYGGYFKPCDVDAEVSICCMHDTCLDNRLCVWDDGRIYTGLCTDETWESPECGRYCEDEGLYWTVESCEKETDDPEDHCCAVEGGSCCGLSSKQFKAPGKGEVWATLDSASYSVIGSVAALSETTSSTNPSATSESKTERSTVTVVVDDAKKTSDGSDDEDTDGNEAQAGGSSDPLSAGAKAGIGVGAAVGAALIIAVAWLGYKYHKHRQANDSANNKSVPVAEMDSPQPYEYYGPMQANAPKPLQIPPQELSGRPEDHRRSELSA